MVLQVGHYYYVKALTIVDDPETVAEFEGDCWMIVGYDHEFGLGEVEPICEMVRSDGQEVKVN